MKNINHVILKGNLTRDPELKFTQNQKSVCKFGIANNRDYGENKKVYFFNCVSWGKTAEAISKYCKKGNPIIVSGELQQRSWDKDGVKHNTVEINVNEIEFLGTRNTSESQNESVKNKPKDNKFPDFEDIPDTDVPDPDPNY